MREGPARGGWDSVLTSAFGYWRASNRWANPRSQPCTATAGRRTGATAGLPFPARGRRRLPHWPPRDGSGYSARLGGTGAPDALRWPRPRSRWCCARARSMVQRPCAWDWCIRSIESLNGRRPRWPWLGTGREGTLATAGALQGMSAPTTDRWRKGCAKNGGPSCAARRARTRPKARVPSSKNASRCSPGPERLVPAMSGSGMHYRLLWVADSTGRCNTLITA